VSQDLRDLYQEVILDHGKRPRNRGALADADATAEGHNPLCGDRLQIYVRMRGDRVEAIGFEGSGCAISMASASMMSEALAGATRAGVEEKFRTFHDMLRGTSRDAPSRLGKLAAFSGVSEFPVRVKCATLAWHTLRAALEKRNEPVSTE
jgi:nitrogen fixation NifU-like protein